MVTFFPYCGLLGFSSPTLSVPNVIPKDTEHQPDHYLVLTPRDDVSFWETSEDPNYS